MALSRPEPPAESDRPRIVVLRALGLGDLLTAVPALRGLRRAHPRAVITLAAPGWLRPLAGLGLGIDTWWPVEGLGWRDWPRPAPVLAVNLHGRGPESIADLLSMGADQPLTHRHPLYHRVPGPAWDPDQHEVRRWCRLLEHGGISTDPTDLLLSRPATGSVAPGAVVIHPGASAPARRWPTKRYAAVARSLHERGERVIVTGSLSERSAARSVAEEAGLAGASCLAGALDLTELAALVAEARLVVCGDTGVAHLASAYRTPSVLLFGPTDPRHWGPPADGPHEVLWAGHAGDPHADEPDPGLLEITVDDVLAAIFSRPRPVRAMSRAGGGAGP